MVADRSSFMITHFLSGISHQMTSTEQKSLHPYEKQAKTAGSNPTAEWHRAFMCAKWAEHIVSLPAHNHLLVEAERTVEIVREVEKTVGGEIADLLELPFGYSVSPRFEVEITWVYEAVHVAARVAAKTSWEQVPWQGLVTDMLSVPVA